MKRLNILAEGATEENFVRDVLAPHLTSFDVITNVRQIITGKTRVHQSYGKRQDKIHKGGLLDYPQAARDLQRWRSEDTKPILTTMFDLYALPNDFPGYQTTQSKPALERVEQLEKALVEQLQLPNFIPYLQLHEFEALLFSDVHILNDYVAIDSSKPEKSLQKLLEIRDSVENPEFINDAPDTAPSKRLFKIFDETYQKPLHGSLVTKEIGLQKIRAECPHFNSWVTKLENIK